MHAQCVLYFCELHSESVFYIVSRNNGVILSFWPSDLRLVFFGVNFSKSTCRLTTVAMWYLHGRGVIGFLLISIDHTFFCCDVTSLAEKHTTEIASILTYTSTIVSRKRARGRCTLLCAQTGGLGGYL